MASALDFSAGLLLGLCTLACQEAPRADVANAEQQLARGVELFERHCALCHGDLGLGDGPAAHLLFPPARDFSSGRFRLVSTENGAATNADLVSTLRRGMPGSAMPSFAWMAEDDLLGLARHVRRLALEGLALSLEEQADESGRELDSAAARQLAERFLEPGAPIATAARAPAEALERGRALYAAHCAKCHGADGGGTEKIQWTEDGELDWARDFTAGVMKGGTSRAELTRRIRTGMPGTSMPALRLTDAADEAALVAFVQTLIPPQAETALVHRRQTLHVRRVAGVVPAAPADPRWDGAEEIAVVLAPLFWQRKAVTFATIRALHDGADIAVRVTWQDATQDDRTHMAEFSDGVALQFSAALDPPLFGMGSREHPVNLWHWKSFRLADVAGWLDLLEHPPHGGDEPLGCVGVIDAPVYLPAPDDPSITSESDSVVAEGFHSVPLFGVEALPTRTVPRWENGVWQVVMLRSLAPRAEGEVDLRPGATLQLACAVWNGALADHGGQKSISIWQRLIVDP